MVFIIISCGLKTVICSYRILDHIHHELEFDLFLRLQIYRSLIDLHSILRAFPLVAARILELIKLSVLVKCHVVAE